MYTPQGTLSRKELVDRYAPLVKRLAYQLMARLPASVEIDDLIQNGMVGLLDALARFQDGQGAQFETYAVQRIRGAMLDGLREADWLPRGLRQEMRRVEAAIQKLEHELGRQPAESELAAALGMSLSEYQKLLADARGCQLVYLEDLVEEDEDFLDRHASETVSDPLAQLEDADLRTRLAAAIAALPEREKLVMALYYEQELNLREIGAILDVTESRVCQLHSQAIARLRAALFKEEASEASRRKRKKAPKAAQKEAGGR
ncbi:MAG: RNA polymerase sigma factor FliA [Rhodocyclaceae bacterium]|nr:RNA polymerase sigma factor FliA [Rhodocyclaceae bacterium]